jgi:hypothetical protein
MTRATLETFGVNGNPFAKAFFAWRVATNTNQDIDF